MTLAHLVAALALGRILARADAVAWLVRDLLQALARWLAPPVSWTPIRPTHRHVSAAALQARPRRILALSSLFSRGPPAAALIHSNAFSRLGAATT